jgi:methionine-rich copper-binding protein CopC
VCARLGGRAVAVFAAAVVGVSAVGAPALAHDRLLASTPEDGADLDAAPPDVVLTFSGEVMDIGAAVTVLDGDSRPVAEGDAAVDGPDVTQALAPDLPDGGYAVRWRVVSSDGHPISGAFTFTVGDPSAAPPALEPATGEDDGATATPSAAPAAASDAPAPAEGAGGGRTLLLAAAGAAVGLLLYLVGSAAARRRARARPPA